MDDVDIIAGSHIEWVSDSISAKSVRPRHLGRPVTFEYFDTDDSSNYSSIQVLGVLEGVIGENILVSGDIYLSQRIAHLKTHRKKLS